MTCKQMGGPCNTKIKGNTEDEMMKNGMKHLEEKHPKMAADVLKASPTDPMMIEWNKKFKKDFAEAKEI